MLATFSPQDARNNKILMFSGAYQKAKMKNVIKLVHMHRKWVFRYHSGSFRSPQKRILTFVCVKVIKQLPSSPPESEDEQLALPALLYLSTRNPLSDVSSILVSVVGVILAVCQARLPVRWVFRIARAAPKPVLVRVGSEQIGPPLVRGIWHVTCHWALTALVMPASGGLCKVARSLTTLDL